MPKNSVIPINYNLPKSGELEISIFGPGRGECIVIHTGDNEWYIVDSCIDYKTKEPVALIYLRKLGVDLNESLKGIIITHWHDDHTKGIPQLVKSSPNANIWFSSALLEEEVLTLSRLYCSDDIGLPEIGNRINSFSETISILKSQNKYSLAKQAKARTVIRQKPDYNVQLIALSPSDTSVTFSNTQASKFLDRTNTVRGFYATSTENFNSVALYLKFNDIGILLGSDLEEKPGKRDVGWAAIIADNLYKDLSLSPCNLFKVAHHGSISGHSKDVWDVLLEGRPISFLTRYSRNLPSEADVKRIRKLSSELYVTTIPGRDKIKRDKSVVGIMNSRIKSRAIVPNAMGHVQIRGDTSKKITVAINSKAGRFDGL